VRPPSHSEKRTPDVEQLDEEPSATLRTPNLCLPIL
jgi:hypothetical protein